MNRKEVAIIAFTAYLVLVMVFMLLVQQFDRDLFFVLALLGLLVIAMLLRLQYVQPSYQRWIGYIIWGGIVIFGAIASTKIVGILAV